MTIGELSQRTGVPSSAIRYYERLGILPIPQRAGGQRRYAPQAVDRLAVLRLAQACGFRLSEMKQLLDGFRTGAPPSRRWREFAGRKRQELNEQASKLAAMQRLVERVLRCNCADFEECGRIASSAIKAAH